MNGGKAVHAAASARNNEIFGRYYNGKHKQ
jgi:hypothetical protein